MGLGDGIEAECSIHDLDIENRNRILSDLGKQVVQDFHELGISFHETEEDITSLVVQILKWQN